ncbi:hypothetical protein ACFYRY_11490 [Streptomyces sp. NPDC005263]|uniref:hypothetical protein n=1 Tax=Streptomyces sp. NPDC005263 TaxID=3364711 RepID=UPI00369C7664
MPQQSQRGRVGLAVHHARLLTRGAALIGSLALLPLIAACGGAEGDGAAKAKASEGSVAPVAGVVAPAKVEVIAALTGCKVEIRIEADELREGQCKTKQGNYRITTFPKEKLKLTWLDAASVYGGTYLVGPQWAVGAKPEVLEKLRTKIGGTMQSLRSMNPAEPAPSAS